MTIKGNVGLGVVDIGTSDTVILNVASITGADRVSISAASLHNTTASSVTVTIYESPDLTSASGDQIAIISIAPVYEEDINGIIGQGYENTNLIAVASAAGVNVRTSVTTYDGGD